MTAFSTKHIHREITQLTPEDSFLVFDRVKDDFDFPVHFHPDYELNFIKNGKGVRRIVGDNVEEIEDIELVLVGPNVIHGWELHNCRNDKIHEICIHINGDLLDDKLLSRRIFSSIKDLMEKSKLGVLFSSEVSYEILPRLIQLSKTENIDYYLEFISILDQLANSKGQRLLSHDYSHVHDFENSERIKKVHTFVQENFTRKIALAEISALINMTPVSFGRFIKKRVGRTFVSYVNDVRISYAARWLVETNLSINEIGFKCGFNNIANFNRIFKKSKNCTPTQYKQVYSELKDNKRFL